MSGTQIGSACAEPAPSPSPAAPKAPAITAAPANFLILMTGLQDPRPGYWVPVDYAPQPGAVCDENNVDHSAAGINQAA